MKFVSFNQTLTGNYRRHLGRHRLATIGILALAIVASVAVHAQRQNAAPASARPQINIELSGVVAREGKDVNVADAGLVNSGEMLRWTIVSKNEGQADALSHEAIGQIPAGTRFVENSAASELPASISYSIDSGKTFSTRPMIAAPQPDGTTKQVPAPVSMYTSVRFHWDNPLTAGSDRTASYQVRVN